jgi:hypothetical protein
MFEDVLSKAGMAVLDLLVSSSITDRFYLNRVVPTKAIV